MQTFLFYDIESSGLHKPFDQVLQFAAIRTDSQLKELSRYSVVVRLNPDTIPAPEAMITHQLRLATLAQGVSEYEAIQHIHRLLNEPGTISLGYNTLQFDDEFLRFSFYRNLLTPYTHQYAHRCGRMDIYPMALMYFLFKSEVIEWPTINGTPTFKLEHINTANRFVQGSAHDAMVDVEATLALARCFYREPEMWHHLQSYFNKMNYQQHISKLPFGFSTINRRFREGLMIEGILGTRAFYQAPVIYCGTHQHYSNQNLWLRLDQENLTQLTQENLTIPQLMINKKMGEPGFILPLTKRFSRYLDDARQAVVHHNKEWLMQHPELLQAIIDHYRYYKYPEYPSADVSSVLYTRDFWSATDLSFCQKFHAAPPAQKAKVIEHMLNPDCQSLAIRLLGRHFPDYLSIKQEASYREYLDQVYVQEELALIDFTGKKRLTCDLALKKIQELQVATTLSSTQREILTELADYIISRQFSYH